MGRISRSRSRSPRRRDRERDRDRDRERHHRRKRSRERSRDRSKDRERDRKRHSRDRDGRKRYSRSRSPSYGREKEKRSTRAIAEERPAITPADLEGKTPDEQEMMRVMGFCSFDTTKGKRVEGNDVGAVHVILKRKYRQYMNRKGGFNRPLDFVA